MGQVIVNQLRPWKYLAAHFYFGQMQGSMAYFSHLSLQAKLHQTALHFPWAKSIHAGFTTFQLTDGNLLNISMLMNILSPQDFRDFEKR